MDRPFVSHEFAQRLKQAVQDVGGARHVAQAAKISEAQLHRYFNGNPIPSDKLARIAQICRVRIGWLFSETNSQ